MIEKEKFQILLKEKTKEAEEIIKAYLPEESGFQKTVIEAMNYSFLAGGKRLRPLFMLETYRAFGGKTKEIEPFMAAIEMIHTYSLVHDDLPAMDNDEYRRGRETTWKVYGDAFGVLAGDGLLNYAFETALKAFQMPDLRDMNRGIRALQILAGKAGIYGMIGGQACDVEAEEKEMKCSKEQLLFIHEYKTAALIQASMMVGAVLAGADDGAITQLEKCAYNIGLAFQIQDDVLDVIGDSEELGKPVGSDDKNKKQTYVTLNGLEQSVRDVEELSREAICMASEIPGDSTFLEALIESLIGRTK